MILYNIHTHNKSAVIDNYEIKDILNVYPSDYVRNIASKAFCSCGIHPWNAAEEYEKIQDLDRIMSQNNVLALGEVGLDKLCAIDMDVQLKVFSEQLQFAVKYEKPVIIHCVRAWDSLITVYKEQGYGNNWIIHGFRGGAEQAKQLTSLGFYISLGEKYNAQSLTNIPLNRLFLETDTSKIDIYNIYKLVAKDLGMRINDLVKLISSNYKNVFR